MKDNRDIFFIPVFIVYVAIPIMLPRRSLDSGRHLQVWMLRSQDTTQMIDDHHSN